MKHFSTLTFYAVKKGNLSQSLSLQIYGIEYFLQLSFFDIAFRILSFFVSVT